MFNYIRLEKLLQKRFSPQLWDHSLGTALEAARLAKYWRCDSSKAYLAGLVHDYAKALAGGRLIEICRWCGVNIDPVSSAFPDLLHGAAAACILPEELGITDEGILNAVRFHTTGKAGMDCLARAVYLADYIEPHRHYPGVQELRDLAGDNPEAALLKAAEKTIIYVINRNLPLHPDTVYFRNSLLNIRHKEE